MAWGPGKYDDVCTAARLEAGVDVAGRGGGVVLMVLGGKLGTGFSVQADLRTLAQLPNILESIAAQLRAAGPVAGWEMREP